MDKSPFDELELFRAMANGTTLPTLTADQRAELDAWENRTLTAEEFAARVAAPWSAHELEDFTALVTWFQRRYPTAGDRLRATRQLAAQWARNTPR